MASRRRLSWTVALAAAVALTLLLPGVPAQARSAHDRLEATRAKLRATRAKIASLRRTDTELLAIISDVGRQLALTRAHLADAHDRLALIQFSIRNTQRRIDRLEATRRARAAQMGDRARTLYMLGPNARLDAVLGSRNLSEFVDRTSTLEFVIKFDQTVVEDLGRIAHTQRVARRELLVEKRQAAAVRSEIADRARVVYETLATRRAAERALKSRIDDYLAEVRALEREQQRILDIINSRGSFSIGPISTKGFQWPIRGRITSGYGPRHGGFHTGIDIDCSTGDRIHAAKGGRVIASEWGGGYGNMIIIDHGNGVSTLYAHQSRRYVGRGAEVTRGQTIGACGSTGHSTGSHLHFEVRVNGHHQNPFRFLP